MAAAARWGGGAIKHIYRLKNDHTGGLFAWDDTTLTTPTTAFADAFQLGATSGDVIVEQSQIAYDDTGIPTFTYNQSRSDKDFSAFLDIACPKKATAGGATRNEKTAEDGRKIGGGSSGSNAKFLVVDYGSPDENGEVLVTVVVGTFKNTSGSRTYQAGELVMPSVEFVGEAAKVQITIPSTALDPSLVTAAALTFRKDYMSEDYHLAIP